MSVERRDLAGGVSYLVRWREAGRSRSKSFSAARLGGEKKALKAAEAYDRQVAGALIVGERAPSSVAATTVSAAVDEWAPAALVGLARSTGEHYLLLLEKHILPTLGSIPVRALTPADVEDWAAALVRQGVGAATVRKAAAVLSSVMQRAVKARHITTNPVRDASLPSAPRQRDPVFITPLQVERMRAFAMGKGWHGDAALFSLLAYSGVRPESEAWPLEWSAVGSRTIHVKANRKRGARDRDVELLAPLASDLAEWRQECVSARVAPCNGGHVGGDGEWTKQDWKNWRRRVWAPAAEYAGVSPEARPRDLRGSFVTLLVHEGRTVVEIARMLGHAPTMTLNTYARSFAEYDRRNQVRAATAIKRARAEVGGLRVLDAG